MRKQEIYEGKLNAERIQAYTKLSELYYTEVSAHRDIFSKGAEWGVEIATNKTIEDVKKKENELLNEFCEFLQEHGYIDTDWQVEEPYAIDEFKKSDQYIK